MSTRSEVFTTRWGMLLAMLGMAIGTGNIWRFPRIAASNGGGSFLVAWAIFLLLWSIPLLILEFGMGKGTRRGSIGSFVRTIGPKFAWMGAWIAWVAVAILFYYTVVMGWTIRFFFATITGEIPTAVPGSFWDAFNSTPQAVGFHALAVGLGIFVVARGVRGIEKAARFLIPSLVILVVVLAIKALTLPGASEGLAFLFTPDFSELADVRIWLEALTQNAWDTGAGWGLVLTYAVYMRSREDTALNAFVIGFGNNSMSLLAGIMVLCTIFSVMPEAAGEIVGAGNEGLTFIWVPQLFAQIPGGQFFMGLFFLALVFAAWSSLVAMIELAVRILIDLGLTRKRAIIAVGSTGFLLGIPSALRLGIFQNQDWVWGVGLMLSGFFFAFAVLRYGVTKWREKFINTSDSDVRIGRWWDWAMRLVAVEAVVLTVWFLIQAGGDNFWSAETWTLFSPYNVGSVLIQFGVVLLGLLALNRWMANRIMALQDSGGSD
ncbi:MAG: sodium-dependent transporter [Gemmatimonadota bacterium]|nr:sodium-dependent transporter [Gemmatimonadota bacterium]MDE2866796.1 sodium-dependent transporter [Gemmatimonadota bacterium]MYB06973.1 sodium-dependent transporter [Gemmatimonadota bacterium]MYE15993.1 sodium-dependent transporter [Gemmatimonadota bacterium]MYG22635.1 sodium-dependent transporter [Gemmatimonadota bacterium]